MEDPDERGRFARAFLWVGAPPDANHLNTSLDQNESRGAVIQASVLNGNKPEDCFRHNLQNAAAGRWFSQPRIRLRLPFAKSIKHLIYQT
jgi:hypothetical protein